MATIRTTCPRCGTIEIGPEDVMLSVRPGAHEGVYWFVCPECEWTVHKPADSTVVALLVSVGVEAREGGAEQSLPVDALEERPEGPPLTEEDVEAFCTLLADDHRLARALSFGLS